jgi:AGZA family xanthine/uracil permease-like MFS transporter
MCFWHKEIKTSSRAGIIEWIAIFITVQLTFSIAEGIVFGMLSHVFLKALSGRIKEVSTVMWVLDALFMLKFFI